MLHDQLVAEMQTIKHAEREHGRSLNFCVVSSVKETHLLIFDCRLPIADLRVAMPLNQIGNWQSAIGNAFDYQSVVSKLDAGGQSR